jgi:hypothetical protein
VSVTRQTNIDNSGFNRLTVETLTESVPPGLRPCLIARARASVQSGGGLDDQLEVEIVSGYFLLLYCISDTNHYRNESCEKNVLSDIDTDYTQRSAVMSLKQPVIAIAAAALCDVVGAASASAQENCGALYSRVTQAYQFDALSPRYAEMLNHYNARCLFGSSSMEGYHQRRHDDDRWRRVDDRWGQDSDRRGRDDDRWRQGR